MANDAADYSYLQSDAGLSSEERYLISQQSYVRGTAAPKLQPQKRPLKQPNNKPIIIMKRSMAKHSSAPKAFLYGSCALLLLGCVIYGKVQVNEVFTQIADANQKYDMVLNEQKRMQSQMESKATIKNVEEYAEQVLGLQKLDQSQIEYIQLQKDDIIAIPEQDKNLFVKIKDKFVSLLEYLRG